MKIFLVYFSILKSFLTFFLELNILKGKKFKNIFLLVYFIYLCFYFFNSIIVLYLYLLLKEKKRRDL